MSHKLSFPILCVIAVAVAACSILYELLLAQTLATTMGNTTLRYNITIGLYIASMGVGALCYDRLLAFFSKEKSELVLFVKIECLLAFFGLCAPFLVLIFDSFFQSLGLKQVVSYHSFSVQTAIFVFNHALIVIIGLFSGLELPLLMSLAAKIRPQTETKVLMFDYFGTLIGAVIFPILLVPYIHLFTMAALISLINLVVAAIFCFLTDTKKMLLTVMISCLMLLNIVYLIFHQSFNHYIIERFYFLGGLF